MTTRKRHKPKLNDLPPDLRGPAQNRFGGHKTQKLRPFRGSSFGAAGDCTIFTDEQKKAWATANSAIATPSNGKRTARTGLDMKKELYNWFKRFDWDIAATLTFAHKYSEQQALAAARRFWNEVDYDLYKNASHRFNKGCHRVMMLEGDGAAQHFHFHGAIFTPRDRFDDDLAFCRYLQSKWLNINPRSVKVEFKPVWNAEGWSWYVTKKTSHFNCDSFDVHSSHIAAPNPLTASQAKAAA